MKYLFLVSAIAGLAAVISGVVSEDYRLVGINAFFAACNAFLAGKEWK